MLDVSNLEKEARFACSNCGAILVVGAAVAVKRSLKEGTGFQRKSQDGDAPAPQVTSRRRRAAGTGGTGGTAAGAGDSGEHTGRGRSRERAEAGGKSKLPLLIGIGVVAVVGAIIAISSMGSGPAKETKAQRANRWWMNVGMIRGGEKGRLEEILAEAKTEGYDQDAAWWAPKRKDVMDALFAADPSHELANRERGRKCLNTDVPGFARIFEQMNDAYADAPDKFKKFVDRYTSKVDRKKKVWLSTGRFEAAQGLLGEFAAWKKKRDANPAGRFVTKAIAAAKQLFRGKEFAHAVAGPWILLTPFDADPAGADGTATLRKDKSAHAAKVAAVLPVALAQWTAKIAKPLGLPAFRKDYYFKVLLCETPAGLATYLRNRRAEDTAAGGQIGPELVGFFRHDTKWAGASAIDDEALKPYVAQDLAHVAIHQLQQYHSQDPKDKYENWFDEWNTKWLNEGLAEWLGGGVQLDAASGKATFTGYAKRRIEFLRQMKDNGVPLMPIRDIVQLNSLEDWGSFYATWAGTLRGDDDIGEATVTWLNGLRGGTRKCFYAHSWYLVHFLHEGKDGKYREQFLAFVKTALRGKYKPEKYAKRPRDRWINPFDAFQDIFGLNDAAQWEKLQKDYARYLKRMLRDAE